MNETKDEHPAQYVNAAFLDCLHRDDEVPADGTTPDTAVIIESPIG